MKSVFVLSFVLALASSNGFADAGPLKPGHYSVRCDNLYISLGFKKGDKVGTPIPGWYPNGGSVSDLTLTRDESGIFHPTESIRPLNKDGSLGEARTETGPDYRLVKLTADEEQVEEFDRADFSRTWVSKITPDGVRHVTKVVLNDGKVIPHTAQDGDYTSYTAADGLFYENVVNSKTVWTKDLKDGLVRAEVTFNRICTYTPVAP
jgi:hypothetical protein